jgi:hypothetical protein
MEKIKGKGSANLHEFSRKKISEYFVKISEIRGLLFLRVSPFPDLIKTWLKSAF